MHSSTVERDWITAAGLRAVVLRVPRGHRCGYVAVEAGHPLHNKDYDADVECLRNAVKEVMDGPIGKRGIIEVFCAAMRGDVQARPSLVFNVHGSLTYSDSGECGYPVESPGLWWFGFDCAHSGDDPAIQDLAYVSAECESLADQLAAISFAGV